VATKFPMIDVTKASLLLPFNSPMNMAKAIGLLIVAAIIFVALVALGFFITGGETALVRPAFETGLTPEELGQRLGTLDGLGGAVLGMFFGLLVVGAVSAHIFNYWVRFAAFGQEGARIEPFGKAVSAALANMMKFMLILFLIGLVSFVATTVLSGFGLTMGFQELGAITDVTEQNRAGFSTNVIVTVIACFVYSLFSANLTQTAIGSDEEALKHPHSVDFAVVLMLIYAVVLVPVVIVAFTGSTVLFYTVNYVLSIFVMFAIPAAHGLRYRICAKENVQQVFEGADEDVGD